MARPGGLGKGLGALIPATEQLDGREGLSEIAVTEVEPNPSQPRDHFDEEALTSLADSITEVGVLQPILVRAHEGGYELIAGERRLRAARRAGLATIPAIVRTADDLGMLQQALIENVQREQLDPLEEAAAYQQLMEDFGLTQAEVAARVGRSRTAVTNTLRLLQLPPSIQRYVHEGSIQMGHARALLGTPDRTLQEKLARRIVKEGLSVRSVEDAVRDAGDSESAAPRAKPSTLRPPGLLELEQLLGDYLDTRVTVTMGPKRGRVNIAFADLEDLERIYRCMTDAGAGS